MATANVRCEVLLESAPVFLRKRPGSARWLLGGPNMDRLVTATLPVSEPRLAPGTRVLVRRPKDEPVGATSAACRERCMRGFRAATTGSRYPWERKVSEEREKRM